MNPRKSLTRFLASGVFAALLLQAAVAVAAPIAPNAPPDLGATPPDLNQSVDPNIIVSFDDSGSMTSNYMGDDRPYDNGSWSGPWFCANAINPDVPKASAYYDIASKPMNGVYYNPNVSYTPPLYEDGTSFPNAKSDLTAVWQDGIAINRPTNAATAGTAGYSNNPGGSASASSGSVTNLTGQYTNTPKVTTSYGGSCPGTYDAGSCVQAFAGGTDTTGAGCPTNAANCQEICKSYYSSGSCKSHYSPKHWQWDDTWTWTNTTYTVTDYRWMCRNTSKSKSDGSTNASSQNPFDGTVASPDDASYKPNGGPVYWRFKASQLSLLTLDTTTGKFTSAALTALYDASNWEAVPVANTGNKWQNFANWYAYYRYRNLMARTALSRVFGVIGSPTSANVRVLWQNINNSTYGGGNGSTTGLNGLPIVSLDDQSADPYGSGATYRAAFFNWIFNTGASGNTPTRTATIRAGNFLCNGLNGSCNPNVSTSTNSTLNPYWEATADSAKGVQLACRQNFHMMMTDGLYNSPAVSLSGSPATSGGTGTVSLPTGFLTGADPSTYTPVASNTKGPTTVFGHDGWTKDSDGGSSYSDIAFYYWINNLNKQLTDANAAKTPAVKDFVPQYFPDQTTGVTDAAATVDPADPGATPEVFWNPANDPAMWPHVVQFAVTLGAFGNLTYSDDMDCNKDTNGLGAGNNDQCFLRTGQTNSSGAAGWPRPNGSGSGIAANIDDLWHAALNSRGAFFVATDPSSLVQHLADIISSILARAQSSTSTAVSNSVQGSNTKGYTAGYDSGSWSGYVYKLTLVGDTTTAAEWDAGCLMTGGTFVPIAPTSTMPPRGQCQVSSPPPTPPARIIFTSKKSGSSLVGVPFEWSDLGSTEQGYLNLDPTTTDVDPVTGQMVMTAIPTALATNDGNGTDRVDYLRGKRDNETAPTSETLPRQFRIRKSLLGPIIASQPTYIAGPTGGHQDIYPVGSPEQAAAAPCKNGLAAAGCNSYEKFVKTNINRRPMLYVGANDGMLHALDALTGKEVWAYVPNMLYGNGHMTQLTNPSNTLVAGVDDTPVINDVFFTSDSKWHTILIGSMRLGGRGIFALDITDQGNPADESAAAGKFLWEFTNLNDADLGYTYASANLGRLHNGKWVVVLSSGYFPQKLQEASATYGKNATPDNAPGASSTVSHLWILDAATGALIRKIDTPATVKSYGLSTPVLGDFGLDQVDDVAVAGDLAGNLWRFDLTNTDPTQWSVEAMFQAYTNNSPCSTTNTTGLGCEPITVMPQAFGDPATGSLIYVFGSGEYLGPSDRTASSVLGTNHFFGVRDFGTGSSKYPMHESDLVSQTLTQDASGIRSLTSSTVPATSGGWMIPLNVSGVSGERNVVRAGRLASAGSAILYSLIPGANNDPCTPGRTGAVMQVNASTGGAMTPPSTPGGSSVVGAIVMNPPATGGGGVLSPQGGGSITVLGVSLPGANVNESLRLDGGLPIWRRTSWRELLNNL